MKISDILNEDLRRSDNSSIYKVIHPQDAQKIVADSKWVSKNGENYLYRSVHIAKEFDVKEDGTKIWYPVIETRSSDKRKPKDMPPIINNWINEDFKELFNLDSSPREIGFFALSNRNNKDFSQYGDAVYKVCPIENYKLFVFKGELKYKIKNRSDVYGIIGDIFLSLYKQYLSKYSNSSNEFDNDDYHFDYFQDVGTDERFVKRMIELNEIRNVELEEKYVNEFYKEFRNEITNFVKQYKITESYSDVEKVDDEIIIVTDRVLLLPDF